MKKLTLFIGLISFFQFHVAAQPCLPQGIHFSTQSQIDSFPINFPNCSEIQGSVRISGGIFSNITNLDSLCTLISIGEDLTIDSNNSLANLNGLNNLTSIGGDLLIFRNHYLISLSGLNNLTFVGNNLFIGGTNTLTSLSGLENINTIYGYLGISHNGSLLNLTGLDNIKTIEGELYIMYNYSLSDLSGLDSLKIVKGSLYFDSNMSLTNLSGIDNITTINGSLSVMYNPNLTSISSLNMIKSIGGDLILDANTSLVSLAGLYNLKSLGGNIFLWNNFALSNLTELSNLTSINGYIRIQDNLALTSLSGLDNISAESITDLAIYNNSLLSTCAIKSICKYLDSPNGNVLIFNNANGCNNQTEITQACSNNLYSISGKITYDDTLNPHQVLRDVELYLTTANGKPEDSTLTDQNGDYQINYISPGNYYLQSNSSKAWGGGNSTDALMIMQHFVNMYNLSGLKLKAADVDGSGYINAMDALYVAQRFVLLINSFPAGDWIFESDSITINNNSVIRNLKGICTGDVDGSYIIP